MTADHLWWWASDPSQEGLPLWPAGDDTSTIDVVAATVEALVGHLRHGLRSRVEAQWGQGDLVEVLRGWPDDAGKAKPSAPVVVAVTHGQAVNTPVQAHVVSSVVISGQAHTLICHQEWEAPVLVTVLCDDRSTRDQVAGLLPELLDPAPLWGARGLVLHPLRYHGLPMVLTTQGSELTDDSESAMLGEWRAIWTLRATGQVVRRETMPAIQDPRIIQTTLIP